MKKLSILFAILIFTAWLRAPSINYGLPYLYNEDEGHHFNRVVNMMKSGDMNPHYFHKPSLHFYLRLPITYAAYIWEVTRGRAKTMSDLDTRDRFGLAQYAFSASHPSLVKANRILSLTLSLLVITLTFYLALFFTNSLFISATTTLIVALSPPLLTESSVIGVDPLMCLFTFLATMFALKDKLLFSAIAAGLACSSKYNAAPIAALPFLICILNRNYTTRALLTAIVVPPLTFLLTSPYILTSLQLFRQHVGYEVWHYAVAGHVGHTETPGIKQFLFYMTWFAENGVGFLALISALLGIVLLLTRNRDKHATLFLFFPIIYLLLMSLQKANFTRNMYVMIPYFAVASAITFKSVNKRSLQLFLPILVLIQPLYQSVQKRVALLNQPESRNELLEWLRANVNANDEIAFSGALQLAPAITNSFITKPFSSKETTLEQLFQDGYSYVVTEQESIPLFKKIKTFGNNPISRIVIDPKFSVLQALENIPNAPTVLNLNECETLPEGHCWLQHKFSLLQAKNVRAITFEAMSPWKDQLLKVANTPAITITPKWQRIIVSISENALQQDGGVLFSVSKIHSPALLKVGSDERRLGVAIKNIRVQ